MSLNLLNMTAVGNVTIKPVLYTDKDTGAPFTYVKFAVNSGAKAKLFQARVVRNSAIACVKYLTVGKQIGVIAEDLDADFYFDKDKKININFKLGYARVKFGNDPVDRKLEEEVKGEDIEEMTAVTESEAEAEPVAVEVAAGEPLDDLPF